MSLAGKRVLILEDEMIVALDLQEMLTSLGAEVAATAMRLDTALQLAATIEIDAAVLDINVRGERSYAVARLLRRRGIPFVFATGYGHVEGEADLGDVPIVGKPYRAADLGARLAALLGTGDGGG
jgi:CheY-like chemotaxis protein